MKKAAFPFLSLVFIIACAVFVYMAREAEPTYVSVIATLPQTDSVPETAPAPAEHVLININTADLDALMTLPGIGPAIGQRIIDYREENGLFMRAEEIMEVSGISARVFEGFRDNITV
jgi:comEA protein